ncbi:MAG: hypothetical protein LW832_03155 [Parachlamydia sp.]|jgi:hypothetical protein|nr:hypothetical protein [Parachlamydia sp.]
MNVARDLLNCPVQLLNTPIVKEGVKNFAGSVTFCFGLAEVYHYFNSRDLPDQSTASKVVKIFAKASILLSACVSRPGVFIISSLAGRVCSPQQLERVFGINTIFAHNPWHIRHSASFAAVILAMPIMQATRDYSTGTNETENNLRWIALFNTLTSRPLLHMGNQFVHFLIPFPEIKIINLTCDHLHL